MNQTNNISASKNTSYYDYYSHGCLTNYSYFYEETITKYEYFANQSYSITYNNSEVEVYQYVDLYGADYKSYVQIWTNGTCEFFKPRDDETMWAKCQNGSVIFYPPSYWFFNYYYY